jgi:quercetin dioxygenase-like cupin family protein
MSKVAVRAPEKAQPLESGVLEYFGAASDSIHLRLHRITGGDELIISAAAVDRLGYVWTGEVASGEHVLSQGSAIIVERGAEGAVEGRADESAVLVFEAAAAPNGLRAGGHVHLLPSDRVPKIAQMSASGVSGALFADAACPSCEVWLHENRFPAPSGPPLDAKAGIHSHEEDEIIFVTGGQMQLGQKLVDPGTAIAIAAGTFYSFLPGPGGLTFVNFRAGRPSHIHFADGRTADEVAIWSKADRPLEYLDA